MAIWLSLGMLLPGLNFFMLILITVFYGGAISALHKKAQGAQAGLGDFFNGFKSLPRFLSLFMTGLPTILFAIFSSSVLVQALGPDVAQSQVCTLSLTDCNIEGFLQIDSSLSTSTAAGSIGIGMLRCAQFILNNTAVPIRFVLVSPSATAGVTTVGVALSVFRATAWTASTAMIWGNPGDAIPVINRLNSFRADTGITVANLTGGTAVNTVMGAV